MENHVDKAESGNELEGLNPPQKEAVLFGDGPLVVFAGAGSGKTRVITHRVARLVKDGVRPWRILAVTFTNKAAGEMRDRLARQSPEAAEKLWVGTFHSVCARLLRRHADLAGVKKDFTIYDDSDQKSMVARILKALELSEKQFPPRQVAGTINKAKQEVISAQQFDGDNPYREIVKKIYVKYESEMHRCGALDFGDLIYRMVVALETSDAFREAVAGRFDYLLVDEFQDTNHAQYRMVRALAAHHQNLTVVGDDDQSIYRWRGADRRNILDFQKEFPSAHIVKLEQNYRSTKRILRVSHAVISRNVDREPKKLWTDNEDGAKALVVRCRDERDEAEMVVRALAELVGEGHSLADFAVFYRTHAQSRVLEETLRAVNVPYRIVGGQRFYDRAEIKDVLAYLRCIHNPDDDISFLRVINNPPRGIGKTTIDRLLNHAAQSGEGLWAAVEDVEKVEAIRPSSAKKVIAFREMMRGVMAGGTYSGDGDLFKNVPTDEVPSEVTRKILAASGYEATLRAQDSAEADSRMENVSELIGSIEIYEEENEDASLANFLEMVTLQTNADEVDAEARVTLMTVHAAKGLEFPVVFVTGLEEKMFPMRGGDAFEDPEELEEERRLAYVAFTRAEERLILSYANVRRIYGQMRIHDVSRFILDLPEEDIQKAGIQTAAPRPRQNYARQRTPTVRKRAPEPEPSYAKSDGAYVDFSEGSDLSQGEVHIGMRVRHPKFGVGTVEALPSGVPPRLRVRFSDHSSRNIVAKYLQPY